MPLCEGVGDGDFGVGGEVTDPRVLSEADLAAWRQWARDPRGEIVTPTPLHVLVASHRLLAERAETLRIAAERVVAMLNGDQDYPEVRLLTEALASPVGDQDA